MGRIDDIALAKLAGVANKTAAVERRRRGIASYREPGGRAKWTKTAIDMLGTMPDQQVADGMGVSTTVVWKKRRLLGIPPYQSVPRPGGPPSISWSRRALSKLGKMSDEKLAKELGISSGTVNLKRRELGIASYRPFFRRLRWTREMVAQLGKATDKAVAKKLGVALKTVAAKRQKLGIVTYRRKLLGEQGARTRRPEVAAKGSTPRYARDLMWTKQALSSLGKDPDTVIAREVGLSESAVARKREGLGIGASVVRHRWTAEDIALLGTMADREVAERIGATRSAVVHKRQELGIAGARAWPKIGFRRSSP